jgi:hypothetical protein
VVLSLFVAPCPLRHRALHFPDPLNCRAEDLQWAPIGAAAAGNPVFARNLPRQQRGARNHNSKLSPAQVQRARAWYREGRFASDITAEPRASTATVVNRLHGCTYQDVPDDGPPVVVRPKGLLGFLNPAAEFTADRVAEVKRRLAAGESRASLARAFGCSRSRVDAIAKGRTGKVVAPATDPTTPEAR